MEGGTLKSVWKVKKLNGSQKMTESSNNNYNAADIERYHAGKMSAMEMHAMEKAAMEDPFLADALEGYTHAVTPRQDLEAIRHRLFGEKKDQKAVPFIRRNYNWMKAAAIIIFIAGGAWLAFRVSNPKEAALANRKTEDKSTTVATADSSKASNFSAAIRKSRLDSNGYVTVQPTPRKEKLESTPVLPENGLGSFLAATIDTAKAVEKEEIAAKAPAAVTDSATFKAADITSQNVVAFNKDVTNMATYNGATRMPLPGFYNNNKLNERKDSNDTDLMKARFRGTDSITNLNIVLQPDNSDLDEVVVSSGKKATTEKRSFELKVDTLEPRDGWPNFDDYIARNIRVPDELKSKQPYAGEVELTFDIDKNGEPVNITVTRSLCEKCDQEAIRLLKEGPKWKKKKAKKGKVTIKF
jgi:hypothetical protein